MINTHVVPLHTEALGRLKDASMHRILIVARTFRDLCDGASKEGDSVVEDLGGAFGMSFFLSISVTLLTSFCVALFF